MSVFLWNILLALAWGDGDRAVHACRTWRSASAWATWSCSSPSASSGPRPYFAKVPRVIRFALLLWELVLANFGWPTTCCAGGGPP